MISCCKDCPDRHMKCHADCERYLAERAEARKQSERRLEQGRIDAAIVSQIIKSKKGR